MKGIKNCGECADYDWRRHKCRICKDEGTAQDPFYADCPLPDVETVRHAYWTCVNTDENVYMCDGEGGCGCTIQLIEGTPEENMFDYCPECGAKMDGGAGVR